MLKYVLAAALGAAAMSSGANAAVLTEDFEAAFPTWESGWFGVNSTARGCYGAGADRGNNPDGLWIASDASGICDAQPVTVNFTAPFAESLSSFSLDVASFISSTLTIFDKNGATLLSTAVTPTFGGTQDPGVYVRYGTTSSNGIGGFSFSGGANGNISIDNVQAITGAAPAVPEPATWALMISGFGLAGAAARRRGGAVTAHA